MYAAGTGGSAAYCMNDPLRAAYHREVVQLLLRNGAEIEAKDR